MTFEDGKKVMYHKRERPKVALDASGVPVVVVNAVTAASGGDFEGWTYTLAQKILGFKLEDGVGAVAVAAPGDGSSPVQQRVEDNKMDEPQQNV